MKQPLVSVIIPVYNREEYLFETFISIYNQSYQKWECILVDDGSTDRSKEICKDFVKNDSRFKFYERHREPKGSNTCRNIGITKSHGKFIYFFDSDDILYPNLLKDCLSEFENDVSLDFCSFDCDFFENKKITKHSNHYQLNHNIKCHLLNNGFMTPSFFTRVETINEIGFWDENIYRLQDIDYFNKLFLLNKTGKWLDKRLYKVRLHPENITSKWSQTICESMIMVYTKIKAQYRGHRDYNEELKLIIGQRITALSISAIASGYYKTGLKYFWSGLFLLPVKIMIKRVILFIITIVLQPFRKNKSYLMRYN